MQNIYLVIYFLFFLSSSFYVGKFILKLFKLELNNKVEGSLFAFGFGCFFYSYIFILLGALQLLYKPILLLLYVVPLILFAIDVARKNKFSKRLRKFKWKMRPINYFLILVLILILYPLIPQLFFYPTSWDPLAYHLALPKLYLADHAFFYYRSFPQTGFPIGIESLYGFGEIFKEPRFATFLNFSFIIGTLIYIFFGLRYAFGLIPVILAGLFFAFDSTLYSEISVTPFVDYPFAFFCLLISISLLNFIKTKKTTWLLAIICFGFYLMIIKLSGILIFLSLLLTLFIFTIFNRKKIRLVFSQIKKNKLLFIASVLISSISPIYWYIKNYVQIRNPFYPFLDNVFKGIEYSPTHGGGILEEIRNINWLYATTKFNIFHEMDTLGDYISLSVLLTFLLLIIFALISAIKHKELRFVSIFSLLSLFAITLFVGPLRRYYLPIAPILTLIAGYTAFDFFNSKKNRIVSFALVCLFSLVLITQIDVAFNQKNNFFGNSPKLTWLKGFDINTDRKGLFKQDNYNLIDYVNKNLEKKDKLLVLFDNRLYYFDVRAEYENPSAYGHFTNPAIKNSEAIYRKLKMEGFTHLFINRNWTEPPNLRKELLSQLLVKHSKLVKAYPNPGGGGLYLYKLN